MKILIVDDDFFFQKALSFSLLAQGHEVLFAIDGQKALNITELHTDFDLIVCDIDMPVLMGHEFIRIMQARYISNPPVVVMVSGLSQDAALHKIPGFNYDYYFQKPLNIGLFDTLLSELCSQAACR